MAVTVQEADFPLEEVTVIIDVPVRCASIRPVFLSMFMIEYALDDHSRVDVAFDGVRLGDSVSLSPT